MPRPLLDRVSDRLLVVPVGVEVGDVPNAIAQGDGEAEACIAEVDRRLGVRPRATGPGAEPRPRPVSPRLSDPYVHEGDDDGGVWVREFDYDGRPAILLWNANKERFEGQCELAETRPWSLWNPTDGSLEPCGMTDRLSVNLPPYGLRVVLAMGERE